MTFTVIPITLIKKQFLFSEVDEKEKKVSTVP